MRPHNLVLNLETFLPALCGRDAVCRHGSACWPPRSTVSVHLSMPHSPRQGVTHPLCLPAGMGHVSKRVWRCTAEQQCGWTVQPQQAFVSTCADPLSRGFVPVLLARAVSHHCNGSCLHNTCCGCPMRTHDLLCSLLTTFVVPTLESFFAVMALPSCSKTSAYDCLTTRHHVSPQVSVTYAS